MEKYNSQMVAALEQAWAEIRTAHQDLPAAVLVVASGSKPGGLTLGHWGPGRWHDGAAKKKAAKKAARRGKGAKPANVSQVAEVMISGEGLQLGAAEVMGTLLHEAAHGLAAARGIKDTSRGGRYHNTKFKLLAEEMGLSVEQSGAGGWTDTKMTPATVKRWRRTTAALDKAIKQSYRAAEATGGKKKEPSRMLLAMCQCDRKIRIARAVFDVAAITCGECGSDFELSE